MFGICLLIFIGLCIYHASEKELPADYHNNWRLEAEDSQLVREGKMTQRQFEKNMEDYSGGQKKKVLLAASLCEQAHLYIWDEPLNFIDVFSRMQLEELICKFKPTMLLVEHDKAFVDKVATKVIEYKEE